MGPHSFEWTTGKYMQSHIRMLIPCLDLVDDTLDTLSGSIWFSMIDLKGGYGQVEMALKDRKMTAFCTQDGLFEFNVMPFGLCNALATFQRFMDCILAGLQCTTCLVYIYEIIIREKTLKSICIIYSKF